VSNISKKLRSPTDPNDRVRSGHFTAVDYETSLSGNRCCRVGLLIALVVIFYKRVSYLQRYLAAKVSSVGRVRVSLLLIVTFRVSRVRRYDPALWEVGHVCSKGKDKCGFV